ncbi:MAG: penicillin-binding protein 2, partial [Proteobacteria bacterium]|nr:penicillin-binding protein 2 [Pseudomonadota bacterium]
LIIFGRLFHLQVFAHRKYLDKSTNNYTKSFVIPPQRGNILDINNEKIAYNSKYWRVIIKGRKKEVDVLHRAIDVLGISEDMRKYIVNQYAKTPFEDFVVYEFLSRDQLTSMEINLPYLPNVYVVEGVARYCKNDFVYSNLLGYVRTPTVDDIKSGKSKHPDVKIGATGLERIFDQSLTGTHGYKMVEMNALGHTIRDLSTKDPISGEEIRLTLDHNIQEFMHTLAQNTAMSSVLMNVNTGNIVGMVSSPTFNSTQLSQKISQDEWQKIAQNPANPMLNRAYQAGYSPGSIFKVIVALAALKAGVSPDKQFYCNGKHKVGSQTFRCWKPQGHGKVDLHHGIKYSCNVYFYNLANYITDEHIKSVALELGLHQVFESLPFYGQKAGTIPDAIWAKSVKKSWYKGDLINTIIGQGYTSCTTMQLATVMARIATGKKVMPKIQLNENIFDDINIELEHLLILRSALFSGANEQGGTSFSLRIKDSGYEFAGKTGTAQVVSKFVQMNETYKIEEEKPNGLFAGFAPFHQPKFSIAAIYENGGYGASSALPFASKVLFYAQKLYAGETATANKFKEDILKKLQ